jgi:hypothetical protein
MEINQALLNDNASSNEVFLALEAIATSIEQFKAKYSHTFQYLCEEGISTGEASPGRC